MSVCFILIFALCIGFMSTATIQPKAEAEAITLSLGAYAILATILGMLGITIASPQILKDLSAAITDGSSAIKDWLEDMAENATGGGTDPDGNKVPNKFTMNLAGTAGFAALVNKIKELFGNTANEGTAPYRDITLGAFGNIIFTTNSIENLNTAAAMMSACVYNFTSFTAASPAVITVNSIEHKLWCVSSTSDTYGTNYQLKTVGNSGTIDTLLGVNATYLFSSLGHWPSKAVECTQARFGFRAETDTDGNVKLYPMYIFEYLLSTGSFEYSWGIPTGYYTTQNAKWPVTVAGEAIQPVYSDVSYSNDTEYQISSIYKALLEKLQVGDVQIDYTEQLDYMTANQNEALNISQEQLLEMVGIRTALESLLAQQAEPSKTTLDEKDLDVPNLPSSLADKFPFCVPFDLVHLIGALNATAVDPVWTIPFSIPSIGINESFTFDLTQFETVAQVIRVFVVLFFVLGLILITRKIIQA